MALTATYRAPGAVLTEREHRVPLDHAAARRPDASPCSRARSPRPTEADRPYLLFLQGGPGPRGDAAHRARRAAG